jgi:Zn finger protein HypA/HybF involved in hydrogenase expression
MMTVNNYRVCRREIRVSDTELYCQKCGALFIGHVNTKYCPQCYGRKHVTCVCCGKKLSGKERKYCSKCSSLTFAIYKKHYVKHDILITAGISEKNIFRDCPVDPSIECPDCPLPKCVLKIDKDDFLIGGES